MEITGIAASLRRIHPGWRPRSMDLPSTVTSDPAHPPQIHRMENTMHPEPMSAARTRAPIAARTAAAASLALLALAAPAAHADTTPAVAPAAVAAAEASTAVAAPASRFHADFEIDPTAYALDGFSLHVGLGWKRLRLDLGAFALAIPAFVHGNEGFHQSFDGYGVKLQYFAFAEQRGGFVGIDAAYSRPLIELDGSDRAERQRQLSIGVNAGWRFPLGAGFYATPWLGIGTSFGGGDAVLDGKRFESSRLIVFPAVHLGYRFR